MALERGLTALVPEEFYEKPFIRRMLDPSSPTIEVDGKEASVRTTSMDGRLFPTVVPQEQADGSFALVQLEPRAAYNLAMETGNFIQFDNDREADQQSKILSDEAAALRQAYKNNQNFLAQGGKGLGDVEFRADVEPYVGGDELTRLGLELHRRGLIELKGITKDQNERIAIGANSLLGGYSGQGVSLRDTLKKDIRDQNPLTKESIMQSPRLATYIAGVSEESKKTYDRPRGQSELAALHELRHGALEYLFDNTDLKNQKYFKNYDIDVEEDIMDMIDNRIIKEQNIPMEMDKVSKLDPKYIGGRDRLETVTRYATEALDKLNVPKPAEQTQPSMLNRLLGKEQGGIMMAQQGQAVLPVTEATSAPQGGGPKGANPAARPPLVSTPQQAPRPGSTDPRDAAIQEVSQKMQTKTAPPPAQPMAPAGGLAAPQQPMMMAKGGTAEEKPEGLAVMIGLGAPTPSYEEAAEGNPPPGATKDEVADDQLVLLSEGELVVPANVVRYHGLGTYEGMRREALMGLQDMEQSGQIEYVSGGKEKADKIDDDGGIVKAQTGTYLMNNPQFPAQTFVPQYKPFGLQTPVAASARFVQNLLGQPQPSMQSTTSLTNPLMLPTVPSSITGVYAPNVGSYTAAQSDGTGGTTTTTSPTDTSLFDPTKTTMPSGATSTGGDRGSVEMTDVTQAPGVPVGNKKYGYSTESSKPAPFPGIAGAAINAFRTDQVRLTDPFNINPASGQNRYAVMSKEKYEELKDNPDRAAVDAYIDSLMEAQAGIDYQRDRAIDIETTAPMFTTDAEGNRKFSMTPLIGTARQIGVGLGMATPFGITKDQQQLAAQRIAEDINVPYTNQSLAEMIVAQPTRTESGMPLAPVFREDASGNLVPITGTPQPFIGMPNQRGIATTGRPDTDQFMALGGDIEPPVTPPTVGLAAPTVSAVPDEVSAFGPMDSFGGRAPTQTYGAIKASFQDAVDRGLINRRDLSDFIAGENVSKRTAGFGDTPVAVELTQNQNPGIARFEQMAAMEVIQNMGGLMPNQRGIAAPPARPELMPNQIGITAPAAPTTMATPRSLSSFGISPEERALAAPVSPARDTFASPEAFRRAERAIAQSTGLITPPTRAGVRTDRQMRDMGLPDELSTPRTDAANIMGTAQDAQFAGDTGPSPEQEAANRAATAARERQERNAQSYERDGFSPTEAANRAAADAQAQRQTGNSNARAAKDRDGNAVTTTLPDGTKGVVTSGELSGDKRDDGKATPEQRAGLSAQGGPGGAPDTGADKGKIVCTEMYRQTQLDDWAKAIKIWDIYQKKYLTPLHEIGYHWLFKPYVHGMKRSGILTAAGAFLAKERTQHLRHILTKGRAKDSFVGNVWCKIIHPIVYLVGKMVYKK